jgi:hypothetical protein
MVTPKYTTYVTVSFPPMIMDLLMEHCYLTGVSRQDLIRIAVRSLLSEKFDKDVEKVIIERLKTRINEKHTNQDPKLSKV